MFYLQFVAHPNCQQVLRCAWLEGWHDWRSLSFASKLSRLLPRIFLLPIIAMMYWAAPRSHIVEKWKSPMNKFFSFAASYALFLIILLIQIGLDHDNPYRSPPMTGRSIMKDRIICMYFSCRFRVCKFYYFIYTLCNS